MKQEVKEKWVAALRSGDYTQGFQYLKNDNKYCCLGVLCELAVEEGICQVTDEEGRASNYNYAYSTPPAVVVEWAEFPETESGYNKANPYIEGKYLTELNDDYRKSFNEIADLIEKHL